MKQLSVNYTLSILDVLSKGFDEIKTLTTKYKENDPCYLLGVIAARGTHFMEEIEDYKRRLDLHE